MPGRNPGGKRAGRFSYDGLDRVIHEKARLGILASLAAHKEGLHFNELKEACSLTDGNLSRHLTVLHEAKLVKAQAKRQGARPQTKYSLTAGGRRRFTAYIDLLGRIVSDASPESESDRGDEGLAPGFTRA